MKKLVCVVGVTASGKTGLGIKLAKEFNGEIVSADSRQVFVGMDLGTGKEGVRKDMDLGSLGKQPARLIDGIPQYGIDIIDPKERYSVAQWKKLAEDLIKNIYSRGKQPLVVGGSHLYVNALINNFTLATSDSEELKLREVLEEKSLNDLLHMLSEVDLQTHQTIDQNNKRRVVRALAASISAGKPFSQQKQTNSPKYDGLCIALDIPREVLYRKIDIRVDERIKLGMIEEVENLLKSGVSKERLISFGLEYKFITMYLSGEVSKEKMIEKLKFAIHGFARRQLTWMRHQMSITWVRSDDEAIAVVKSFL